MRPPRPESTSLQFGVRIGPPWPGDTSGRGGCRSGFFGCGLLIIQINSFVLHRHYLKEIMRLLLPIMQHVLTSHAFCFGTHQKIDMISPRRFTAGFSVNFVCFQSRNCHSFYNASKDRFVTLTVTMTIAESGKYFKRHRQALLPKIRIAVRPQCYGISNFAYFYKEGFFPLLQQMIKK